MITKFNDWHIINRTLPTAYDESLTYLEVVQKLMAKTNEVIDEIDAIQEEWESEKADIEKLKVQVSELSSNFETFEAEINAKFTQFKDEVVADIQEQFNTFATTINLRITNLENKLNGEIEDIRNSTTSALTDMRAEILAFKTTMTTYTDSKVEALEIKHDRDMTVLNDRIDNIVFEYPDILNPMTGRYAPIQTVIEDIYSLARTNGITAAEFDDLVITCSVFDDMQLTASAFDVNGKNLFNELNG